MELKNKVVKYDPNIYFVEGFYDKHYLIVMSPKVKEVKVSRELINLLKISHDESISISDAYNKGLRSEGSSEHLNKLLTQINWLSEKGMINLI